MATPSEYRQPGATRNALVWVPGVRQQCLSPRRRLASRHGGEPEHYGRCQRSRPEAFYGIDAGVDAVVCHATVVGPRLAYLVCEPSCEQASLIMVPA